MFLLDSNVWITFLRKPLSLVVPRLRAKATDEIRVCSVVVAELFYGTLRSANPLKNRAVVEALIAPYTSASHSTRWLPINSPPFATISIRWVLPSVLTICKSLPSHWLTGVPS